MQDRWENVRLFIARLKVEFPELALFPKFRATLTLVTLLGMFALLYGRAVYQSMDARMVSLLLSCVAWAAATLIVLLHNPFVRIWRIIVQSSVVSFFFLSVISCVISYSTWFLLPRNEPSSRMIWTVFTIIFIYCTISGFRYAFGKMLRQEPPYPGRFTSPFLFGLGLANAVWWYWPTIRQFFL